MSALVLFRSFLLIPMLVGKLLMSVGGERGGRRVNLEHQVVCCSFQCIHIAITNIYIYICVLQLCVIPVLKFLLSVCL